MGRQRRRGACALVESDLFFWKNVWNRVGLGFRVEGSGFSVKAFGAFMLCSHTIIHEGIGF